MRYVGRTRRRGDEPGGDDPLTGVANLFDIGLVFIVGLLVMLFNVFSLHDLLDPDSEVTITKKVDNEELEIITKKGTKIEARKVTKKRAKGRGERLGVAYRLEDGSMVYVPN
ncbi:MAG: DUF2149 domain-containing protein [Polyangia bacterium]